MKKLMLFFVVVVMVLSGCAATGKPHTDVHPDADNKAHDGRHESNWVNWSHMKFSLWGYKNPTDEDLKKAKEEGWWGTEVPLTPEK
jgi:uncharacterized protein YceK